MAATRGELRFYVYRFMDWDGNILYIGKGTGRRLESQERRFGMRGEIVKRFHSQPAAYDHEARLIAKHKPIHNKCKGGGGSLARRAQRVRLPKEYYEIERMGTRLYVVKMLNRMDTRGYLTDEQRAHHRAIEIELESNNQRAA